MSASTPANRTKPASTLSGQRTRLSPREWLVSFVVHLVIFGLLVWFLPDRELIEAATKSPEQNSQQSSPDRSDPKQSVEEQLKQDPERVKEVVEQIEKIQSDNARSTVEDILSSERAMDDLAKDSVDQLNKEAEEIAPTAAPDALADLQKVPSEQDAILQDQAKLNNAISALLAKTRDAQQSGGDDGKLKTAFDSLHSLQDQINQLQEDIRKNQVTVEEAQSKAREMLTYAGDTFQQELESQTNAGKTQNSASDSETRQATLQAQALNALGNWAYQSSQVRQLTQDRTQLKTDIDALNQQIPQMQATFDAAAKAAQVTRDVAWQAGFKADQSKSDADRQAANAAKAAIDPAQAAQDAAGKVLTQARIDLTGKLWSYNFKATQITDATKAIEGARAPLDGIAQQLPGAIKDSQDLQTNAKQGQQDALSKLAAANGQKGSATTSHTAAHFSSPVFTASEPNDESLQGKSLAELYKEAQDAEGRIAEKYRTFRAAQLATIRKTSLGNALSVTQVAKPDREKLNTDLLAAKGAATNLASYKDEVLKANQQLGSMATLGSNMVAQAESEKDIADVTVHGGVAGGGGDDPFQMMSDMATADQSAGKDLTGFMEGMNAGTGGAVGGNGHGAGNRGRAGGVGDGVNYLKVSPLPLDRARYAVPGFGRNAPELPGMDYEHIKAYATRRIEGTGPYHTDWLYVDSWYLIGPFPNPGRRNLNTKFPPESIVDLNAVYPGKNGTPIRWVFTQWNEPPLIPAHAIEDAPAIYYAYTEIYFDQPGDIWVTSGSDDKGTMWINSVMVWKSGDQLKSWIPNEGYRKVHFVKGYNRVLYRLENAQLGAVFSLMLSTK